MLRQPPGELDETARLLCTTKALLAALEGRIRLLRWSALRAPLRADEVGRHAGRRLGGEKLVTTAKFHRFAAHGGFKIRAFRPQRARTTGKLERPISYVHQAASKARLPSRTRISSPNCGSDSRTQQRAQPHDTREQTVVGAHTPIGH